MVLQRALQNKAPVDQADDWRLPSIIEEYKRGNVHPYLSTRTVAETPTDLQQPAPSFSFDGVWPYNRSDSYWLSECYVFYYTTALMLCSQLQVLKFVIARRYYAEINVLRYSSTRDPFPFSSMRKFSLANIVTYPSSLFCHCRSSWPLLGIGKKCQTTSEKKVEKMF